LQEVFCFGGVDDGLAVKGTCSDVRAQDIVHHPGVHLHKMHLCSGKESSVRFREVHSSQSKQSSIVARCVCGSQRACKSITNLH
jgi:hypothetical protein